MAKQYGFSYDEDRCIRCRTCEVACKSAHDVEPGLFWRRVLDTWQGNFPDIRRQFLSVACMHCAEPACIRACPTGAIVKRDKDGLVLVDRAKCNGCRECLSACPYSIPQFGKDGKMQKCDYCTSLGTKPVCVVHCPSGALSFGDINRKPEIKGKTFERYSGSTNPSLIILKRA